MQRESISALKRKMGCTGVYTYTALSRAAEVVEWLGKTDAMTMIYRRGHLSSKTWSIVWTGERPARGAPRVRLRGESRAHSRAVTRCSPRAHNTMDAISRCIYVQTCKMELRKSLKYYMEGKARAAPGKSKKKTRHKGLDIQAASNLFHELPDARRWWWWRRRRCSYIGEKQQLARKGENHVAEELRTVRGASLSLYIYTCVYSRVRALQYRVKSLIARILEHRIAASLHRARYYSAKGWQLREEVWPRRSAFSPARKIKAPSSSSCARPKKIYKDPGTSLIFEDKLTVRLPIVSNRKKPPKISPMTRARARNSTEGARLLRLRRGSKNPHFYNFSRNVARWARLCRAPIESAPAGTLLSLSAAHARVIETSSLSLASRFPCALAVIAYMCAFHASKPTFYVCAPTPTLNCFSLPRIKADAAYYYVHFLPSIGIWDAPVYSTRGFYFKFGHIHFKLVLLPYDIVHQAIARHIGLLNKLRFDSRPLLSRASDSMRRTQCRLYTNPRRQNFNSRDILDESDIIHSSWLYTRTVKTEQQKKRADPII
ncbi:unnamed protein product [Trichogramma brassicae]|uniref:Uncharacterized protein n=1 Tax=Trichogramma brassicae TaxID=86971 RepID=A0A6H5J6L7_9HYME|nr:unnamed protein product [Trichogramma brassicae]